MGRELIVLMFMYKDFSGFELNETCLVCLMARTVCSALATKSEFHAFLTGDLCT